MLTNVRQTLVLLGLLVIGREAIANAHMIREQGLQLGNVELNLGVGLLNGQAEEKVYEPDSGGQKVSQLNWDIRQVPTLHLGLTYHALDWLSLDMRGWTRMSGGNSHMTDYDWNSDKGADWSDYSDHPDTRLKTAWQAEVSATAWALRHEGLALGVTAGYQRSQFDWQSLGGSYIGSSRNGYRDEVGEFSTGTRVISYQQSYATPYLGIVGLYKVGNWALEGRFKYSQWVKATDFDTHHLRDLTFSGDHGNQVRMQSLALGLMYRVNSQWSLKAGIEHQVYAQAKGSALIKHVPSGQSLRTDDNSTSQSNRTTLSTLTLAYQF